MNLSKLVITVLLLLPQLSFALRRDGRESGGGDAYAIEFVTIAQQISFFLKENPSVKIDGPRLDKAIASTTVESTNKELILDGKAKDAINYPAEGKIVFNRKRWEKISSDAKPVLVLHEYLGIMRVPDIGYSLSKEVLGLLPSSIDEDFQRGVLSVVKKFPILRDQFSNDLGVGFISVAVVLSNERTINPCMLVIGLPDGASDWYQSTVDIQLQDIQDVKIDGTDLVITGDYYDPNSDLTTTVSRRVKIKNTAGSDDYIKKLPFKQ
jgi:hypothetical protein